MNTLTEPIELLFYQYDPDYDFSIWYFPEEAMVRIYLNGHKYDTICLEVSRHENQRSEDNIRESGNI